MEDIKFLNWLYRQAVSKPATPEQDLCSDLKRYFDYHRRLPFHQNTSKNYKENFEFPDFDHIQEPLNNLRKQFLNK
jgi:hypothetical protein